MSIDRAATLRQAEKLLRQGKLDLAIAEYQRLVDDQPKDWNTGNLLGDLYVRAGQLDAAIAEFSRIAASLRKEGFFSKAAALNKKILKLRPDDDHAQVEAGELAAEQGLLADARALFIGASHTRRNRGDERGALELTVRIAALDPHDVHARLAGAHARQQLDDRAGALRDLRDLATMLVETDRELDAVEPLRELVAMDPGNVQAARELARILVRHGRIEDAAVHLTADTIGEDVELMLVAIEGRLRRGDTAAGLELVDTLLAVAPSASDRLEPLVDALAASHRSTAFDVVDRVVSVRIADANWAGAAEVLRRFVGLVPDHVPALTRLVGVCVDGGLAPDIFDAQALLADAYLATGAAAEAKYVAEDLVTRQPENPEHVARLRKALALCGEADPDRALDEWLASLNVLRLDDETHGDAPAVEAVEPASPFPPDAEPAAPSARPARTNPHEIDLGLIFGRDTAPPEAPAPPAPQPSPSSASIEEDLSGAIDTIPPVVLDVRPPAPAPDIESVFADLREQAALRSPHDAAELAYARGIAHLETGQFDQGIEQLRTAMRAPSRRFAAASMLATAYQKQGRMAEAIEWLGHAVDVPGVTPAERFDTLYRLADLLETTGEVASALAVCLELQADAGTFRDVDARIARLSQAQAGG